MNRENDTSESQDSLSPEIASILAKQINANAKIYRLGIVLGISIGAMFAVVGSVLIVLGISGGIEWIFEATNLKGRVENSHDDQRHRTMFKNDRTSLGQQGAH